MESCTISPDGRYVGEDRFLVPRDFGEFFDRDPSSVRRWLTKRMRGRIGRDALLDLEQDLLLHLCLLPEKSKFRRKGANGRAEGCADVIQCFDPVRHYGATVGCFYNFVHLCLSNRLNTILARQRKSPLHHPNNLSLSEEAGEVSEEYLLAPSWTFKRNWKAKETSENIVLLLFIGEFITFAEEKAPEVGLILNAIQSTAKFTEAQDKAGMDCKKFSKQREQLAVLKDLFFQRRGSKTAGIRL